MLAYSCKQTETKSGHPFFNLIHSVNVYVCVCGVLRVEVKHSADTADFPPEGGEKRNKKKIDTTARF